MKKMTLGFVAMITVLAFSLSGTSSAAAAPPAAPSTSVCSAYYVVRWGDNLTRVALRYGTTVHRLATLNGITNPNRIYAGQSLCVQAAPTGGTYYTVRWGDTLSSIAWRFGVNFWHLAAVNGLGNPNLIYAGQVLWIP